MKFVYFGYDFMLPSILRLLEDGHELMGVFSFEVDNVFNFNQGTQALAQKCGVPFTLLPATEAQITAYLEKGTEVFLAAGYPSKIPPIEKPKSTEHEIYAVNVHPTFLPKARGLMPIPRMIMQHMDEAAGFTAHKMTQRFDAGDILLQIKFTLGQRETVETYTAKIAINAPEMFSELMRNLPELWENATPQNEALSTNLKAPTEEERFLNWIRPVAQIDAVGRAFGRFGSLARFDDKLWVVYDYDIWKEKHAFAPGTVAARQSREITIAALDGFVCLKEIQLVEMPEQEQQPAAS